MKKLVFPKVSVPRVSVVMVAFGARSWVRRSLLALIEHTEPCYEVILVDNAPDGSPTGRLEQEVENARVLVNPVNRGFGPANNEAANLARGSLLVFLNSDALVHDGWLSALAERIEGDPEAAAAAPRMLNLDGTLQEAGALLFGNGYTQFYGFGDDPDRAPYRFAREVDYASAACLMVRRRAFFEVGGFDAVYAPAYYEDVDLCLSLREKGYRILYEPRSLVTHARGASSSPGLAVRLWQRNHPLFYGRWNERLTSHPEFTPTDGRRRLQIAARDAPTSGRILLVTEADPGSTPRPESLRDLTLELSRLYPRSLRTIVSDGAAADVESNARLARQGWEVLELPAVAERAFHYDAVIFQSARIRERLEPVVDESQPQAVRLSADEIGDLAEAMAAAGLAPEGPGTAATAD